MRLALHFVPPFLFSLFHVLSLSHNTQVFSIHGISFPSLFMSALPAAGKPSFRSPLLRFFVCYLQENHHTDPAEGPTLDRGCQGKVLVLFCQPFRYFPVPLTGS
jgi:hypothetical protein